MNLPTQSGRGTEKHPSASSTAQPPRRALLSSYDHKQSARRKPAPVSRNCIARGGTGRTRCTWKSNAWSEISAFKPSVRENFWSCQVHHHTSAYLILVRGGSVVGGGSKELPRVDSSRNLHRLHVHSPSTHSEPQSESCQILLSASEQSTVHRTGRMVATGSVAVHNQKTRSPQYTVPPPNQPNNPL